MKLKVQIACPDPTSIDLDAVAAVFPYGNLLPVELKEGGMRASSGVVVPELGDKDYSMIVAIAAVYVGY